MNEGVAPTYLAWKVVLRLVGPTTVEAPLALDLRQVQPDAPLVDDEAAAFPASSRSSATAIERARC